MLVGLLAFACSNVVWQGEITGERCFSSSLLTTGNRDIGLKFDTLVTSEPIGTGTIEDTYQALGICPAVNSSVIPYVHTSCSWFQHSSWDSIPIVSFLDVSFLIFGTQEFIRAHKEVTAAKILRCLHHLQIGWNTWRSIDLTKQLYPDRLQQYFLHPWE